MSYGVDRKQNKTETIQCLLFLKNSVKFYVDKMEPEKELHICYQKQTTRVFLYLSPSDIGSELKID